MCLTVILWSQGVRVGQWLPLHHLGLSPVPRISLLKWEKDLGDRRHEEKGRGIVTSRSQSHNLLETGLKEDLPVAEILTAQSMFRKQY